VVWSTDLESPIQSNLALADGVLQVSTMGRIHYALDARDGSIAWQVEDGTVHSTSPAVIDGKVITGSRSARLTAYDAATGEKAWAKGFGSSWVQSGATALGDGAFVVGSSDSRAVQAFDAADVTTQLWYSQTTGWPWGIPAVADDVVYETQMMIDYQEPWDTALYALDATDGHVLWTAAGGDALEFEPDGYAMYGVGSSPLVAGDYVVVAGLDGVVRAFRR
jgi:outer membrane protein assembly factor BamB